MKALAYVRVSTKGQAEEGLSLEAQQQRVEAHIAAQEGWTLVMPTFIERGVSGRRDDRPELARLMAAVERGEADRVVIPKLDRFGRSVRQLHENFDRLDRNGVGLVSLSESIDTGTSVGRLLRSVLAALAEFELDTIGERVASVTAARAAQGRIHGRMPYGYRPGPDGIEIVPEQAEIVRRVFRQYTAGGSQRAMAQALNAEGIPTKTGVSWQQSTISTMLANPVYIGTVRLNGEQYAGIHEPIIDMELWDQAKRQREAAARSDGGRGRVARHLLAYGMLRCPHCGAAMRAVSKPTRTPGTLYERYACGGRDHHGLDSCPQVPLEREPIDSAVWDFFRDVVLDVEATKAEIVNARDGKLAEVTALADHAAREAQTARARLDRVRRDYQDGHLEAGDWVEQREQLQGELDGALASHERLVGQREQIAQELDGLDADSELLERLSALRALIVGEVRDGQGTPNAFRAALRRTFERFNLMAFHKDGRRIAWGLSKPDPDLTVVQNVDLSVDFEGGEWSYALVPYVRHEVVEDWDLRDGVFPAVQRAVLGGSERRSKPFLYAELLARVRALLRRAEGRRSRGVMRVGELTLDPATRAVRLSGRRVELAAKEFALLQALAEQPTRVYGKQELLRDVWGYLSPGNTRTLDAHAYRLRRKLRPSARPWVVNVRGVGYKLTEAL